MEQNINNINENANIRKLATVAKILSIDPIDGADNIEYAKVRGWRVVVKKGEFKVGDLCIYIEVDSLMIDGLSDILKIKYKDLKKMLSKEKDDNIKEKIKFEMSEIVKQNTRPEFEFLRNSNFRIKTREIFGQISQGICFPLSILNDTNNLNIKENLDVTDLLGVVQYVIPEATIDGGDIKGELSQIGIITSDEERIENLEDKYEKLKSFLWFRTEKMEGTSISLYLKNDEFGVCGRTMNFKQYTNDIMNNYWSTAVKLEAETKMREFSKIHKLPNFCLQGELIGAGVQGNIYKLFEKTILFYNSFNLDESQYFYFDEFIDMIKEMNLLTVPILDTKFELPDTSIELLKMVDYAKTVFGNNPDQIAEGQVFIANGNVNKTKIQRSAFGRLSFKAKSRIYDTSKK